MEDIDGPRCDVGVDINDQSFTNSQDKSSILQVNDRGSYETDTIDVGVTTDNCEAYDTQVDLTSVKGDSSRGEWEITESPWRKKV